MGGSAHLSFTVGGLSVAGGLHGFIKTGSKMSLGAGGGLGALLIGLVLFAVYAIDWETLPPPSFLGAKPFGDKAPWAKGGAWRSSSGEIDVGKLEQETGKGEL